MRNTLLFGKEYWTGKESRKAETNRAMAELMENPKISGVLLDRIRQREFFETVSRHVGEGGEFDTDTLRSVLGELYSGGTHISKMSVERIADALLTENRGPKYFTYPEDADNDASK